MTGSNGDHHDRLIAAAAARAADQFENEGDLGAHLWTADDGSRGYGRQDGGDAVVTTVLADGCRLEYRIVGADYDLL